MKIVFSGWVLAAAVWGGAILALPRPGVVGCDEPPSVSAERPKTGEGWSWVAWMMSAVAEAGVPATAESPRSARTR